MKKYNNIRNKESFVLISDINISSLGNVFMPEFTTDPKMKIVQINLEIPQSIFRQGRVFLMATKKQLKHVPILFNAHQCMRS